MQVFAEFVRDELPEDHLLPILRELLPVLLAILGAHDVRRLFSPSCQGAKVVFSNTAHLRAHAPSPYSVNA